MRDSHFKGKQLFGKKLWVIGYLILSGRPKIIDAKGKSHYVDKNTISEFTGCIDKDNTNIYEQDILFVAGDKIVEDAFYYVIFEDGMFCKTNGNHSIPLGQWTLLKESIVIGNTIDMNYNELISKTVNEAQGLTNRVSEDGNKNV